MAIEVQRIEAHIVDHPLRAERVIVSHAGRHDASRFVEVCVHGPDGTCGFGEAATTPLWNGESAETATWAIANLFAPWLEGSRFEHPSEALARMDIAAFGLPFSKSAVDTALWDLWGRLENRPCAELFGDRAPLRSIPTRASVGAYGIEETLKLARAFWSAGVRTLKFKIGVRGVDDAARLRAVREALGSAPVFTVDANGAYATLDQAVRALEALLPFDLALIEQPVPRERRALLAQVRRKLPVPILIDEGVFTPQDLADALDADSFDYLSLYPGKNGGFTRSLEMARTAQRAGKACVIGSNLETDLGQAASACLAASVSAFPADRLACDLSASLYYERSAVNRPLEMREGNVAVPAGPGFGVEPLGHTGYVCEARALAH